MPRKPHRVMRPQAVLVKAHNLAERIEPPPMRVAGQIAEGPQFAEDGQIGGRAQGLLQRGQVRDAVPAKVGAQGLRIEGWWPHNVRVPPPGPPLSEL